MFIFFADPLYQPGHKSSLNGYAVLDLDSSLFH